MSKRVRRSASFRSPTSLIFRLLSIDLILVLQEGSLVEQGTHEELLSLNGLYAEMWRRQEGGEDLAVNTKSELAPEA